MSPSLPLTVAARLAVCLALASTALAAPAAAALLQVDVVADPAAPWLADAAPVYQAWLDDHHAGVFLQLVAPVVGSTLDAQRPLRVHLTAAVQDQTLRARTVGDDITVQVRREEAPDRRADVIVHEAVHALQQRAGSQRVAGLPPDAEDLLAEAVATALGQGVWRWLDHALDEASGAVAWRRGRDRYAEDRARPWYVKADTGRVIDAWARALEADVTQAVAYGTLLPDAVVRTAWQRATTAAPPQTGR